MKMTLTLASVTAVGLAAAAVLATLPGPTALAADGAPDGKALFLAQKCNMCHAVSSAEITATTTNEKLKGPDLTSTAGKRDAAWLAKYLAKQEAIDGKKHSKEFKGSEADLNALIDWLQKQTQAG
jgi:mono/diheme cytochrome c family protein